MVEQVRNTSLFTSVSIMFLIRFCGLRLHYVCARVDQQRVQLVSMNNYILSGVCLCVHVRLRVFSSHSKVIKDYCVIFRGIHKNFGIFAQ